MGVHVRETELTITGEQMKALVQLVITNPVDMLLSERCRRYLAQDRWEKSEKNEVDVHADTSQGVMPGAIAHNRRETEQRLFASTKRQRRLLNPLSGLEPVYSQAHALKVLTIGPRTEMEIFALMAIGFQLKNIVGLDLVSSSPYIDTGDMHKMPYADRAFDVVISSWVIAYSREPQQVMDEMMRVCVDGGLIAVGTTYEPGLRSGLVGDDPNATAITGTNYKTVEELKALMRGKVDRVYYQQDIEVPNKPGPVMMIAKIKH